MRHSSIHGFWYPQLIWIRSWIFLGRCVLYFLVKKRPIFLKYQALDTTSPEWSVQSSTLKFKDFFNVLILILKNYLYLHFLFKKKINVQVASFTKSSDKSQQTCYVLFKKKTQFAPVPLGIMWNWQLLAYAQLERWSEVVWN